MSFVDENYFRTCLAALPIQKSYTKAELLIDAFRLQQADEIEIYYTPHNEYVNVAAKVMIVGITPGWKQLEIAYRTAIQSLKQHKTYEEACKDAKIAARFAGATRVNLIQMLDEIGIHNLCGISSAEQLFDRNCTLLHTTSLVRYPVFVAKRNYNGHNPSLIRNEFLEEAALQSFVIELEMLEKPLIVPLGKSVESFLRHLIRLGLIAEHHVIWGFPHPSGANGHRLSQFEAGKAAMIEIIEELQV